MRSRPERRRTLCTAVLMLYTLSGAPAMPASTSSQPTEAEVSQAVTKLRADPNLGAERKIRNLKWAGPERQKKKKKSSLNMEWLVGFFSWIASAGRLVLWVAGGLLLVLLAYYVTRFFQSQDRLSRKDRHIAPTHVRDLDIRPESLPADIGAAALELWNRGEHRAALSLLYRGLLSRLAHAHAVPIRDSSTEGECLELARAHLSGDRVRYVSQLIRVWQRAVYGGQDPDSETVQTLCAEFSAALDAPSASAQPAGQPA